jgi:hypothetical protein
MIEEEDEEEEEKECPCLTNNDVLIVDDNTFNIFTLRLVLSDCGISQVDSSLNG